MFAKATHDLRSIYVQNGKRCHAKPPSRQDARTPSRQDARTQRDLAKVELMEACSKYVMARLDLPEREKVLERCRSRFEWVFTAPLGDDRLTSAVFPLNEQFHPDVQWLTRTFPLPVREILSRRAVSVRWRV